jgi:hypothetical protein
MAQGRSCAAPACLISRLVAPHRIYDARTAIEGLPMHVLGSLGFAVFTVVNLIVFVVVLSGLFHRNK